MLQVIEKFIFEKFTQMPPFVRVITYLVMLCLFIYLLLIPKFINGHLAIKDSATGKAIDYRGGELRMNIEGRTYKFTADEDGYWSIPIVSKLPEGIKFEIHNIDKDEWHKVALNATQVWLKGTYDVEMTDGPPFVRIVSDGNSRNMASSMFHAVKRLLSIRSKEASAGELQLLQDTPMQSLTKDEKLRIKNYVIATISRITGKRSNEINLDYPFSGRGSPSYTEKILIIGDLEKEFDLKIPDEHWKSLESAGQLIDYIEKRQMISKVRPVGSKKGDPQDWETIKRSFPDEKRPIFKR